MEISPLVSSLLAVLGLVGCTAFSDAETSPGQPAGSGGATAGSGGAGGAGSGGASGGGTAGGTAQGGQSGAGQAGAAGGPAGVGGVAGEAGQAGVGGEGGAGEGGVGGAGEGGNAGEAGAGAGGVAGDGGAAGEAGAAGDGGAGGGPAPCCSPSLQGGCSEDVVVEQCVCKADPYCCETRWDLSCVGLVGELGCGAACEAPIACGEAPANGLCAQAIQLSKDGVVEGKTGGVGSSGSLCGGHLAPEVWYSYTVISPALLDIQVTTSYAEKAGCEPALRPVIYLRDGCGVGAKEILCGEYTLKTDKLGPGTYYLAVDGRNGDAGDFTLEVKESTPCAGDVDCQGVPAAPACDQERGRCVRCTSDVHCTSPFAPACDSSAQQCVSCVVDAHCKDPTKPRCDSGKNACVACLSGADCKAPGSPFCNTNNKSCSACLEDKDCPDPLKPACNLPTGSCAKQGNCCEATSQIAGCVDDTIEACVCAKDSFCCETSWDNLCAGEVESFGCGLCGPACAKAEDCVDPARPVCVPSVGKCAGCAGDANCKDPATPVCKPGAFRCVECTDDGDCGGEPGKPRCSVGSGACVACVQDADCGGDTPFCSAAGGCVACRDDDDCGGSGLPACDPSTRTCVPCLSDFYCTDPAKPACDATKNVCVKQGDCCEVTPDIPGCSSPPIESCVCVNAPQCCTEQWSAECAALVEQLGCSVCGPACKADGDCKDPARPACVPGVEKCAACSDDSDCKAPNKPSCNPGVFQCVRACCAVTAAPGCAVDDTIEACVCAKDSFCCETSWDSLCAAEVVKFGCGACP